jgi:SAM-dependent methyltransferase
MSEAIYTTSNAEQRRFWSEDVGDIWVAQAGAVDAIFAPVLSRVLAQAGLRDGDHVLDIGCGAGSSTFEAATQVGAGGTAFGLDISEPLLAAAQADARGAQNTTFILGDAQSYALPEGRFDSMISRFGVMFFADTTAAFRNIAGALKPGGRISFATWGAIAANPFFTLPAAVSKAHFGPLPKSDPDGPGPFALRDVDRVLEILTAAGFAEGAADPQQMLLTPDGTAQDMAEMMCEIGPAKGALSEYKADAPARAALIAKLVQALEVYATPQGLRIPAEINFFTARIP